MESMAKERKSLFSSSTFVFGLVMFIFGVILQIGLVAWLGSTGQEPGIFGAFVAAIGAVTALVGVISWLFSTIF